MSKSPKQRIESERYDFFSPQTTSPILLLGWSIFLNVLDWADRISFALSLGNENMAEFLQMLVDYSWVGIPLGIIWWVLNARRKGKRKRSSLALALVIVAVYAFIVGASVAARNANQPAIVTTWGSEPNPGGCTATIETEQLVDFMDDHDLILVCGPDDPTVDLTRDKRVHISEPRTIVLPDMYFYTVFEGQQVRVMKSHRRWWFRAVLIPKNIDRNLYSNLEELERVGGILVGNNPVEERAKR